ncbi:MAG TPA: GFA family protein [Sedimentisphaerales bacterium]|nr:GFA family protein [Sedimentisphaerales bacterium]
MLKGSCYCGAVKYEIHGRLLMFVNCHCPDCRKFTGSAFSSVLAVESDGFKVASGQDNLVAYESSPGKRRSFCKTCGCHVFARAEQRPGMVIVRAGSLDDDPQLRPQCHIWTSQKAPWHEICDAIPQHPEGLPKK